MIEKATYKVKRSNRKTISILVERDGSVTIRAPKNMPDDDIKEVVKAKEYLIYKHLAEWEQLNSSKVDREFVNGQSYLYLGRNYRLRFIDKQDVPLKLKNGFFLLKKSEAENAEKHFINFYKEKGLPRISEIVESYQKKMGVSPNQVKVMELQNRWGSCSKNKNLNFHWKCVMAPLRTLEYIVVHELAHLIHMNHSSEFWNEVDKVFPQHQKEVEWLKRHGASMDL